MLEAISNNNNNDNNNNDNDETDNATENATENVIKNVIENNNNNNNNNSNNNNNEDEGEDENEDDDDDDVVESENDHEIRQINYCFKTIDRSESFENQIKLFKKVDYLSEFWNRRYYDDDKGINLKIFKLKLGHVSDDVDKNLFEEVFGYAFVTLANKIINTRSKEENQIIINDLKKNRDKLYEREIL